MKTIQGFFSLPSIKTKSQGKPLSCLPCGLHKLVLSPRMEAFGNFRKGILNIGEAPGEMEDKKGKQWQGKVGKLLEETYADLGIDLFDDCLNINAINCRPTDKNGNNRPPTDYEIACCRQRVLKVIGDHKPKVIILLGNSPLVSLIGHRWKKDLGTISKWRGWTIPDQEFNAWICPTFHPSFVARNEGIEAKVVWKQDLKKAIDTVDLLQPNKFYKYAKRPIECIEIIEDLAILDSLQCSSVTIDYETTGLKPHTEGHKIVCASIADDENHCYSFLLPEDKNKLAPLIRLLNSRKIGKIAHGIKFENAWGYEYLQTETQNWIWDTMLASHVLDSRAGITNLKFQTYVNYGEMGYGDEIDPFLKGKEEKNANSMNRIEEFLNKPGGKHKTLIYCGLDALFTYRLAQRQIGRIETTTDSNLASAYGLLHKGILALGNAERQGMVIDTPYCQTKKEHLTKKINRLGRQFQQTEFAKHWRRYFGGKCNFNSNPQLGEILYDVKKIPPTKLTETRKGSTDEEALSELKLPELDNLLGMRKLKKLRDTYLDAFLREQVNGILSPFFNLHLASTYRSSSDHPNFQNIPIRDKVSMQTCRRAIIPRPGYQLLELDYQGIEVRIAACHHRDPNMLEYINNPKSDLHLDMAKEIYMLEYMSKDDSVHKILRFNAKNGFVFPQFYGDYYVNCARSLACDLGGLPPGNWKRGQGIDMIEGKLSDHLISCGIKSLAQFTEHVKKIEEDFWGRRFPVYQQWKENWWLKYQKKGYLDMPTGFRCSGLMSKNEVINRSIQGTAFHCLLWAFIEIDKIIQKENWRSRLIGQIHDSMLFDVHPQELEMVMEVANDIACNKIRKVWPWIITPLVLEAEICDVNRPWSEKRAFNV